MAIFVKVFYFSKMLNQKLLLQFFFSILFISPLSAQETGVLKGKIIDDASKEYLPGATIRVVNNLSKGTVSDLDGNYSMVLDTGYHQLFCVFVGSLNDTFSVHIRTNAITEKNINLLSSTKFLDTTIVSKNLAEVRRLIFFSVITFA